MKKLFMLISIMTILLLSCTNTKLVQINTERIDDTERYLKVLYDKGELVSKEEAKEIEEQYDNPRYEDVSLEMEVEKWKAQKRK